MAKPKTSPGNNRPTPFTRTDAKVLHKVAASEIQQLDENVIRHNQVGFTAGLQGAATQSMTVTGGNHVTFPAKEKRPFTKSKLSSHNPSEN